VIRRVLMAVLSLVLVVAGAAYVGYAAVRRGRPVALPAPSGAYGVGRTTYEWTDAGRTDPFAPQPGTPRRLSVWVWYPAAKDAAGERAAYAPGLWSKLHFSGPVGLGEGRFESLRNHALADVPVATGRFPVVVLMPGMGFSAPFYSTLAEDLASHGYVVAGVTPTYSANVTVLGGQLVESTPAANPEDLGDSTPQANAEGERIVATWASDARFAAARVAADPRFAGRTGSSVGYAGHSFGGAAALEACRLDPHCAGAADLDGSQFGQVVQTGLDTPLMLLGSEDSCITGTCGPAATDSPADRERAQSLLRASTGTPYCFTVDGARHFNFTDYGAFYLALPIRKVLALGGIDGDRALTIQNAYVTAFFDQALRHAPQPLLTGEENPYPEARRQCRSAAG
jgi:dienelactone hydrolase